MVSWRGLYVLIVAIAAASNSLAQDALPKLTKLPYNHAEERLVVDAAVGLWCQPLPMDWEGDGDLDLVMATAGVPSNGAWLFENVTGAAPGHDADPHRPSAPVDVVFKPGRWVSVGEHNMTVSYVRGRAVVLTPGKAHPKFNEPTSTVARTRETPNGLEILPIEFTALSAGGKLDVAFEHGYKRPRANQWKLVDFDGDDATDLVIGLGVWDDYGWDDAFNPSGVWTNGPLHGYVYVARNEGTDGAPKFATPVKLMAGDEPVDTYGAPSPNFADFDGDGDLDLVCGEFLDALTYFENVGTRTEPKYAKGRYISRDGRAIRMDLQMLQVVALDWDADGDVDLVVGQEDGRAAIWEHTGRVEDGMPVFEVPKFFRQEAGYLQVGVLPTPVGVDWDGDGDDDLIAGDTAGYINFVENIGYFEGLPIWAPPVYLDAGGERIRIQAGTNGGIQGPCEAKWGYTAPAVGDWDMDGDADLMLNSIWGEVLWYENIGTTTAPELAAARPVEVLPVGEPKKPAWFWWEPKGNQLVTQWRTSPYIGDMTGDGKTDLVILDHEGYLALFEGVIAYEGGVVEDLTSSRIGIDPNAEGKKWVWPGKRVFLDENGAPLRLNDGWAGKSGRRKLVFTDWDGDGKLDLMLNGKNIDFWKNVSENDGEWKFKDMGPVAEDKLAGHTTAPAIVDWNKDGVPDLVMGAEDGFLYYLENPRSK